MPWMAWAKFVCPWSSLNENHGQAITLAHATQKALRLGSRHALGFGAPLSVRDRTKDHQRFRLVGPSVVDQEGISQAARPLSLGRRRYHQKTLQGNIRC